MSVSNINRNKKKDALYSENSTMITDIEADIENLFKTYENQNNEYVSHCQKQIASIEAQIKQIQQQAQQQCRQINFYLKL
jgi:hypothetical protein